MQFNDAGAWLSDMTVIGPALAVALALLLWWRGQVALSRMRVRATLAEDRLHEANLDRTRAQTRIVRILAEAVGGCMVVEAIGKQGHQVRLTVKQASLREPQPDLFG